MIISRCVELISGTTSPRDDALPGKQQMNQEFPFIFPEAKRVRISEFLCLSSSLPDILIDRRLIHSMQQPGFSERRIRADHAIENEEQVVRRRVQDFASELLHLVR